MTKEDLRDSYFSKDLPSDEEKQKWELKSNLRVPISSQ